MFGINQQTKKENRVVGELEKLPNLNRLDILKLSQIIMSDPMKVKLLFNLDEDLSRLNGRNNFSKPHESPCRNLVDLLSLGWIDRNFRLDFVSSISYELFIDLLA